MGTGGVAPPLEQAAMAAAPLESTKGDHRRMPDVDYCFQQSLSSNVLRVLPDLMPGPYVIAGGGPCGLAAAWHLARRGVQPIVLEAEDLMGGLCATHERDGFRFNLGGHRFVSGDAELSRWVEGLLGSELREQERRSVVLHEGRRFRYPLEAVDLVRNLGVRDNAAALAGYVRARIARGLRPGRDVSFEDWVTSRFGRPLYDRFFGPYTQKLWGLHPSRISADWAAERISLLDLTDVALRLLGLRSTETRTYARRYLYPRLGMGQLYRLIADDVVRKGGIVRSGTRVVGVVTEGARVSAVRIESASGAETLPVGELLSTMPLPGLARLLRPELPEELERAARALRFRALTFVNLMLARPDFSENTWMYVASGRASISRIQEPGDEATRWPLPVARRSCWKCRATWGTRRGARGLASSVHA